MDVSNYDQVAELRAKLAEVRQELADALDDLRYQRLATARLESEVEKRASIAGPLRVWSAGTGRVSAESSLDGLPDDGVYVVLVGSAPDAHDGAREAASLLYQPARVVPA